MSFYIETKNEVGEWEIIHEFGYTHEGEVRIHNLRTWLVKAVSV